MSTLLKTKADQKPIPILLDSLRVDTVLDFDLHLMVNDNLVLYRSADLPFDEENRQKLLDNRIQRLFIVAENRDKYQKYIEKNLGSILEDPAVQGIRKAQVLYETSTNLVKDVLSNPTYGENIERSISLVTNTVQYILKGRESFLNMLRTASFDYYLYTHSVNVCTFSIALARQLGHTKDGFLNELGLGALLHDVGKSKISERILYKKTALNKIEFEIMKKHPQWGVDILSQSNVIPQAAYYPVRQHHERGDRSGYPDKLSLEEMHIYSRIVAIADCFDAMTTERVYQKAIPTYPALKLMLSMKKAFDDDCLKSFVKLMGPKGPDAIERDSLK
ncbi:MAG: HD-GYP domain-containing protein [Candidatus Zixiibacteriota bacterium]